MTNLIPGQRGTTNAALCPLHDDTNTRLAAPPSPLCLWHVTGVRLDLERLADTWPDLTAALASAGGIGQRVTGTPEKRLPINDAVSEARRQIAHDVHYLAHVLIDESSFTPHRDEGTVPGLARWLSRHYDWLACHGDAVSFAETIADDLRAARAAAYPSRRRRFEVHACPADGCGGMISAWLAPIDDVLPSTLRCDSDVNHVWSADQWLTLGRQVRKTEAAS